MSKQEIRVGQIWRRKKNGRLIRISAEHIYLGCRSDDWYWRGHDYKGKGISYGSYIRRDCELVSEGEAS